MRIGISIGRDRQRGLVAEWPVLDLAVGQTFRVGKDASVMSSPHVSSLSRILVTAVILVSIVGCAAPVAPTPRPVAPTPAAVVAQPTAFIAAAGAPA